MTLIPTALSRLPKHSLARFGVSITRNKTFFDTQIARSLSRLPSVRTMSTTLQCPPFTSTVVNAMRSLYPEELADRAWDNVGLLQENIDLSSNPGSRPVAPTVLLTNDLTVWVAEEAIRKKVSVIVSYHPFIFRGLKSVTLSDPQQRIVLQLAQNNIAVYSPHTAIDAAPGGMNDWLADMLDGHGVVTKRSVVQPIATPLPTGFGGSGYGRLVEFSHPVNFGRIVEAFSNGLGGLRYLMVARPKHLPRHSEPIAVKSVAICAGSGYDILKSCPADVLVTGEMSHHNALKAIMEGKCIITVFHSNSERRFLKKRLQRQLLDVLRQSDPAAEVLVSETDEDPFEIWDVQDMPAWTYERQSLDADYDPACPEADIKVAFALEPGNEPGKETSAASQYRA